jgi:electron transfer flavoprotein alpha subunit
VFLTGVFYFLIFTFYFINMSVLVLVEHSQGTFKKKSFEAVQYAAHIANALGTTVTAVATGNVGNDAMQALGNYGATKVLHTTEGRLENFNARAYTKVMLRKKKAQR